jgi:hypothetical protein
VAVASIEIEPAAEAEDHPAAVRRMIRRNRTEAKAGALVGGKQLH